MALWVATVLVTFATQNSNLIPIIILLGSFLVPVTFVTCVQPRRPDHHSPSASSVPSSSAGLWVCSALRFWKRSF